MKKPFTQTFLQSRAVPDPILDLRQPAEILNQVQDDEKYKARSKRAFLRL